MNEAPRVLLVHLQKTAGTALLRRLRHGLGPDRVHPRPDEQGTPEVVLDVDHLRARLADLGPEIRVVTGHFPLCTVELLDGPMEAVTVLRDPVERVLSFLRHQREVEPRFAGWTLEEVYDDPISTGPLVSNHMVKMLGMTLAEMTEGALTPITVSERHLERAEESLTERLALFGLQEEFEEFCSELAERFGWDLGPPVFMNRTEPGTATEALRQRITEHNRFDVELYAAAVELRDARRSRSTAEVVGPETGTVAP